MQVSYTIHRYFLSIIFFIMLLPGSLLYSQIKHFPTEKDKAALEGIFIERYHVADSNEILDTTGGALPMGAVTYRIYVDINKGYSLQAVYGVNEHPLFIKTSTKFYNNIVNGQGTGDFIDCKKIAGTTAVFDSWLTMEAATKTHNAVEKAEDTDGCLLNAQSLNNSDGMIAGQIKPVTYFGIIPNFFNSNNASGNFTTDNGSWAIFGGIKGPTDSNKVLIAQLTTDGDLSFQLNVQLGSDTGYSLNFVAKNPQDTEIECNSLSLNK